MLTAAERRQLFASINRYLWAMRPAFPPARRAHACTGPAPHCPTFGAVIRRPACAICGRDHHRRAQRS